MGDARLIAVGRVAGAFGVRGEVRITAFTEEPLALARFRELRRQDGSPALTILSAREAKGGIVCRCPGVETKEQADALRGLRLFVPREALPAPDEDEFYLADLIGLRAVTPDGAALGRVDTVHDYGGGASLEIGRLLVPFTRTCVPVVDIAAGTVTVIPPDEINAPDDARDGDAQDAEAAE